LGPKFFFGQDLLELGPVVQGGQIGVDGDVGEIVEPRFG
jgi:hypothetical protein